MRSTGSVLPATPTALTGCEGGGEGSNDDCSPCWSDIRSHLVWSGRHCCVDELDCTEMDSGSRTRRLEAAGTAKPIGNRGEERGRPECRVPGQQNSNGG